MTGGLPLAGGRDLDPERLRNAVNLAAFRDIEDAWLSGGAALVGRLQALAFQTKEPDC